MFPGDSCYPISPKIPEEENRVKISGDDQLMKIIETLGVPNEDDISFLKDSSASNYLKKFIEFIEPTTLLAEKFKTVSKPMLDLLTKLLEFNP